MFFSPIVVGDQIAKRLLELGADPERTCGAMYFADSTDQSPKKE